jgi:hypothetical protein
MASAVRVLTPYTFPRQSAVPAYTASELVTCSDVPCALLVKNQCLVAQDGQSLCCVWRDFRCETRGTDASPVIVHGEGFMCEVGEFCAAADDDAK